MREKWLNGVIVQLLFLFEKSNTPLGHILVVTIFAKKLPYFSFSFLRQ